MQSELSHTHTFTHVRFRGAPCSQDYLICIEMFFASLAFTYAFTHKDYLVAKNKVRLYLCLSHCAAAPPMHGVRQPTTGLDSRTNTFCYCV
jgi:hypothetical protein